MSLGTLPFWNFGPLVRSRSKQYLLHAVSVNGKGAVMVHLREQHCEEMKTMEGNYYTINRKQCLFEYVPFADQAWQTWAANEVSQTAMYQSPHADVSTSTMSCVKGSIGTSDSCTWKVWSAQQRERHVKEVEKKKEELSQSNLTSKQQHGKLLQFLRDNGTQSLGQPRIDIYVDKLRPEVSSLILLDHTLQFDKNQ